MEEAYLKIGLLQGSVTMIILVVVDRFSSSELDS